MWKSADKELNAKVKCHVFYKCQPWMHLWFAEKFNCSHYIWTAGLDLTWPAATNTAGSWPEFSWEMSSGFTLWCWNKVLKCTVTGFVAKMWTINSFSVMSKQRSLLTLACHIACPGPACLLILLRSLDWTTSFAANCANRGYSVGGGVPFIPMKAAVVPWSKKAWLLRFSQILVDWMAPVMTVKRVISNSFQSLVFLLGSWC